MPNLRCIGVVVVGLLVIASPVIAKPLQSKDGKVQIEMPRGWEQTPPIASERLRITSPSKDTVAGLVMEAKIDLDHVDTLGAYAEIMVKQQSAASTLAEREVSAPRSYNIGDRPAIEYKVTGVANRHKTVIVYVFVELPQHWGMVMGITVPSQLDNVRASFDEIAKSVLELPKRK